MDTGTEIEKLKALVERMRVGMLTTVDAGGALRSRPLHMREFDTDNALWFFIDSESPKVDEAAFGDGAVNLSYADTAKYDFVSISGTATVVRDRAKMQALWTKMVEVWFPRGLDDPHLALLRVQLEKAEYWASPSTAVMRLFGFAKALATGDTSGLGEDHKIEPRA